MMTTNNPQYLLALGAEHQRELGQTPCHAHPAPGRRIVSVLLSLASRTIRFARLRRRTAQLERSAAVELATGDGTAR